jgi:hypothetical protein
VSRQCITHRCGLPDEHDEALDLRAAVIRSALRVTAGVTDNPDVFTVDGHDLLALREAVDALEGQR